MDWVRLAVAFLAFLSRLTRALELARAQAAGRALERQMAREAQDEALSAALDARRERDGDRLPETDDGYRRD